MKGLTLQPVLSYLFFLASFLFFFSCTSAKKISIPNQAIDGAFNKSFQTWQQLKKDHNNTYQYEVSIASWVGYRSTTKIVVRNGQVISRSFSENQLSENGRYYSEEMTLVYTEDKSTINSHNNGAEGLTIDQVYEQCGTKSLQVSEVDNKLFFKTDKAGVIESCGSTMKNCMDDCSMGVYIANFQWME
ncbi:MAG: hypothetical protein AAF985_03365 [Bacteroidota bacterium]